MTKYGSLMLTSAYDGKILYQSWRNRKEQLQKYGGLQIISISAKVRISSFSDSVLPYMELAVSDYNMRFKKEK